MPDAPPPLKPLSLRDRLRLRMRRRRLQWRAFRSRHDLTAAADRTRAIPPGVILAFAVIRNEVDRLPHWLDHHRALGVGHFLIVDNGSDDGSAALLAGQGDVSLWTTTASYRGSRFGLDWTNWLLRRHGAGRWCLTLDADELFAFPHDDRAGLADLTAELNRRGVPALGALMVDLFPKGPLAPDPPPPFDEALARLKWFDASGYRMQIQHPLRNRWVQGGVRDRAFFADRPHRAPTLNKLPLVRWRRGYVYVNSTHSALPAALNEAWDGPGDPRLSGALLHTKFLPEVVEKSRIERARRQHFAQPDDFDGYYDALIANPDLWTDAAARLDGWRSLVAAGLMATGGWEGPTRDGPDRAGPDQPPHPKHPLVPAGGTD